MKVHDEYKNNLKMNYDKAFEKMILKLRAYKNGQGICFSSLELMILSSYATSFEHKKSLLGPHYSKDYENAVSKIQTYCNASPESKWLYLTSEEIEALLFCLSPIEREETIDIYEMNDDGDNVISIELFRKLNNRVKNNNFTSYEGERLAYEQTSYLDELNYPNKEFTDIKEKVEMARLKASLDYKNALVKLQTTQEIEKLSFSDSEVQALLLYMPVVDEDHPLFGLSLEQSYKSSLSTLRRVKETQVIDQAKLTFSLSASEREALLFYAPPIIKEKAYDICEIDAFGNRKINTKLLIALNMRCRTHSIVVNSITGEITLMPKKPLAGQNYFEDDPYNILVDDQGKAIGMKPINQHYT